MIRIVNIAFFQLLFCFGIHGQNYQERFYFSTNGFEYFVGESILIGAFCLDEDGNPGLSQIGYIEIVDDSGKSIEKLTISLSNGMGESRLFIPSDFRTGNYKLVGYTKWMLNFENTHLFEKEITIINPLTPYDNRLKEQPPELHLTFLNQELVADIPNVIYFDHRGFGSDDRFEIIDEKQRIVRSGNFPIDSIHFFPSAEKSYQIKLTHKDGILAKSLPEVANVGFSIVKSGQILSVFLKNLSEISARFFQEHNDGHLPSTTLPINQLVNRIDLSNYMSKGAIRVIFYNKSGIKIGEYKLLSEVEYHILKKMKTQNTNSLVNLTLPEQVLDLVKYTVSVHPTAIINQESDSLKRGQLSHLIFPGNLLRNSIVLVEDGHYRTYNKRILPDFRGYTFTANEVPLSYAFSPSQSHYTTGFQREQETVWVLSKLLQDQVFFHSNVDLDNAALGDFSILTESSILHIDSLNVEKIDQRFMAVQLENMFSKKKRREIPNLSFYGTPDIKVDLDLYTRFKSMQEVIEEIVSGVKMKSGKGLRIYNDDIVSLGDHPLVLLNSIPIEDHSEIPEIDPLRIQYVEVVQSKYYYHNSIYDGIVNFIPYEPSYSVDDRFISKSLHRSVPYLDYNKLPQYAEIYLDYRRQLYWHVSEEPFESTNTLSFYTSSIEGGYQIIVEGIDEFGKALTFIGYFQVASAKE